MPKNYSMRAYDEAGAFLFGATIHAADDAAAVAKFQTLPLHGRRAELLDGRRRVAERAAEVSPSRGETA